MDEEKLEIPVEEETAVSGVIESGMTLYDINKRLIEQMPMLNDELIEQKKKEVRKFIKVRHPNVKYYMLLGRDLNYYTLFRLGENTKIPYIEDEVVGCLQDLGAPIAIDVKDDSGIECWIKNSEGAFMLMFFPYDLGVIECQ